MTGHPSSQVLACLENGRDCIDRMKHHMQFLDHTDRHDPMLLPTITTLIALTCGCQESSVVTIQLETWICVSAD